MIGAADPDIRGALTEADRDGVLRWHGYLPNDRALGLLSGSLAGLSLLRDQPNYRHSRPTKAVEYMAHGVPVVTTPTPLSAELVERYGCGLVVPYEDPATAAMAVRHLRSDRVMRRRAAARGWEAARADLNWADAATEFVMCLESWVKEASAAGDDGPAVPFAGDRAPTV